jgi:tetratricopeptide (TPR) repeat protein
MTMMMKKRKNTLTLVFVLLLTFSCSEEFIELAPLSEVSAGSFYNNESDIEQAVIAAYASLQSSNMYKENFLYFMEGRSDNSYFEDITQTEKSDFDFFRETASNSRLNDTWNTCYIGIQRCNIVLNRIDGIAMDENLKSVRKGEVKFIRALIYFNMVRMWGGVPVVLQEVDDPFGSYGDIRQPVSEVYAAIIDDLQSAISSLPDNQGQLGRVTKGAALTLLGKVYMTLGQWNDAVTTLNQVLALGYQILPNYADVFDAENENNQELIFSIQFASGFDGEGSVFRRMHMPLGVSSLLDNVSAGAGFNLPTQDLFNAFSDIDLRKVVSVPMVPDGRLYTNKFTAISAIPNDEDNNFIVLRYADVALMLAEAINELGYVQDGEAFSHLNIIRTRAGLPQLNSSVLTNQEEFKDAILLERRLEFSLENHRWFDLVRTGKAIEVMQAYVEDRGPMIVEANKHELFPIPQAQIDIMNSPDFLQNPGY